jgi:peroxiredoxin
MQQLVALNEMSAEFKELNTRIIAFSNNPPSKCAEVVHDYHIDTSVIDICSDTDNTCSRALGTTITEKDGSTTDLHAFLVLDKGLVVFEHYSATPLMGFASVMDVLKRLRKR